MGEDHADFENQEQGRGGASGASVELHPESARVKKKKPLKCGREYQLREGEEPTTFCDSCAHNQVEELRAEVQRLIDLAWNHFTCLHHNDAERAAIAPHCPVCLRAELEKVRKHLVDSNRGAEINAKINLNLIKAKREMQTELETFKSNPGTAFTIEIERIQTQRDQWRIMARELAAGLELRTVHGIPVESLIRFKAMENEK